MYQFFAHSKQAKSNDAASQEGCIVGVLGCANYRRIALHDKISRVPMIIVVRAISSAIIKGAGAFVFSAVEGLQRVHDIPDGRDMENLHHKPDDTIDCLIIVGFSKCEHDSTSDDKQNQEWGEQSHHPVHSKTWVERALRIYETPCVEVDDVAHHLEERSHGTGPWDCDTHNERLYLQECD